MYGQREEPADASSPSFKDEPEQSHNLEDIYHKRFELPPYPYTTLGVSLNADSRAIRKAWQKLAFRFHPDRAEGENQKGAVEQFEKIREAYDILSDPTQRSRYDAKVDLERRKQGWQQQQQIAEDRNVEPYATLGVPRDATIRPTYQKPDLRHQPDEVSDVRKKELKRRRKQRDIMRQRQQEEMIISRREQVYDALINQNPLHQYDKHVDAEVRSSSDFDDYQKPGRYATSRDIQWPSQAPKKFHDEHTTSRARGDVHLSNVVWDEGYRRRRAIAEQARRLYSRSHLHGPKPVVKKPHIGILVLEGSLNDSKICAIPDTGAEGNIIALSFARSIGLDATMKDLDSGTSFRMANGKVVQSLGTLSARWRFKRERSESFELDFHVLRDCIFDVLVGDEFLRSTQTMSLYRHRLSRVPRPTRALYVRSLNLLGCPAHRLKGQLDGDEIFALPDSGSELNLVSWQYADQRDWLVTKLTGESNLVQFADGSLSRTEGQISAVFRFSGTAELQIEKVVVFDVLYDLPFDVVLGQDFLEDTQAFATHEKSFLDVSTSRQHVGLNLVIWYPGRSKVNNRKQSSQCVHVSVYAGR